MAISILNNIPALAAENQLTSTQASLQKTLYELSSGSRINSGADDAAGLAIANGLQANITALQQSSRNATDGVGKLQVADGALSQVTALLNRAVTLATESANGTVNDGSQRAALDAEFQSIKAEIDRIGTNTTYNGAAIFNGGQSNYNQVTISDSTVGGLGLSTKITGQVLLKGGTGGTAYTFTSNASDATVGDLIDDINTNGSGLIASLDGTGDLVVTDTKGRGVDANTELQDNTSTLKVGGDSTAATVTAAPTNASSMSVYLSDSTTVGSSTISVALNQFDSAHMNGSSIANDDLLSSGTAQTALKDINTAIAQVAALRGDIGAGINRLQAASNVMSNQVQNLTSAESNITSADIASDVANMTKFNVLNQTGISALSQSNQMQQSVLKLLQ
ncbi:MAG TPA: flagellin [candidate division Zixibacteria bacterium]|nr:flagellin [candidate division Zixibacteria bacterium]